jgi:hypothetical protein
MLYLKILNTFMVASIGCEILVVQQYSRYQDSTSVQCARDCKKGRRCMGITVTTPRQTVLGVLFVNEPYIGILAVAQVTNE